ncbi:MAG: sulfatase [Armatimonadota bacterium]|nr:MAG: sulfatase [Armatimonadota bacterium]
MIAAVALAFAACGYFAFRQRPAPERFVLIVLDSLRADRLGCYGNGGHLTPALDALAAQGVRFDDCWSVASWTIESNCGLFTGRYPSQTRAGDGMHLRSDAFTLAEAFRVAGYATAAFSSHKWISPDYGFGRGFNTFRVAHMDDDRIADACIRWIKKHRRDSYFVLLYFWAPHFPYKPEPANIPAALRARLAPLPEFTRNGYIVVSGENRLLTIVPKATGKPDEASLAEIAALRDLYELYVRDVDARVGRVLRSLNGDDRCVVAVTADHGEEFLDHGFLWHQMTLYRELLHVPLLIRGPGLARAVVETPVSNLDITPTFLSLAGLAAPRDLVGRPLLPASGIEQRLVFSEMDQIRGSHALRYGVRSGDTAVIYSLSGCPPEKPIPPGGRWEVYDLKRDPTEQHPGADPPGDLGAALSAHTRDALAARAVATKDRTATPEARNEMMRQFRALGYLAPN